MCAAKTPQRSSTVDRFRICQRKAAGDGYNKDFRHHRRSKAWIRRWARRQLKQELEQQI